ncbi:MAG: thermonuclease family protein [Candidatus Saccharibacteria bacterium]
MKFRIRPRHFSFITLILFVAFTAVSHYRSNVHHTVSTIASSASQNQPGLYPIDHFIDGDTIAVNMNGTVESVRFIGVDTPETHKPNTPVQCYGEAAAAFTKQQIGSGSVRLKSDSESTNRDRYNRLLRYVYLPNGELLDEKLVTEGYGFAYTQFPFTKSAAFVRDEDSAKAMSKGLWGSCKPYQESNGRWQSNTAT